MLSQADREALRLRQQGLLQEVTSLKAERTQALTEASESQQDVALIEEVARLEAEKDAALKERDEARDLAKGSVEDAMAAMNAAAGIVVVEPVNENDAEKAEPDEAVSTDTAAKDDVATDGEVA